jgi:hypothetical protein
MNPRDATQAAIRAVASSIERTPQAVAARGRAIVAIAVGMPDGSDRTKAEHDAIRACAEAAVAVMERDPALGELVSVRDLGLYVLDCAIIAVIGSGTAELRLRDPHAN